MWHPTCMCKQRLCIILQIDCERYIVTLFYNHRYNQKCTRKCLTVLLVYCTRAPRHSIWPSVLLQVHWNRQKTSLFVWQGQCEPFSLNPAWSVPVEHTRLFSITLLPLMLLWSPVVIFIESGDIQKLYKDTYRIHSIRRRSQLVAAPPKMLNKIVTALK